MAKKGGYRMAKKQMYFETEKAKITITFSDRTEEELEQVYKDISQACYKLCLHGYLKRLEEEKK